MEPIHFNGWHILLALGVRTDGWWAYAKRGPFVTEPFDPIAEPGELWMSRAVTRDMALALIQRECLAMDAVKLS